MLYNKKKGWESKIPSQLGELKNGKIFTQYFSQFYEYNFFDSIPKALQIRFPLLLRKVV